MPLEFISLIPVNTHVMEVTVRVPIFQAYETTGHFQFFLGTPNTFGAANPIDASSPNPTCNSWTAIQDEITWPKTYATLVQPGGACEAFALEADMLAERISFLDYIDTYHYPPFDGRAVGAYSQSAKDCWAALIGSTYSAVPAILAGSTDDTSNGLVTRWSSVAV
jgi:hypothetical protein